MLGVRVVHRDHRERQHALALHRAQPDDARGRLLRAADHVRGQVLVRAVELGDEVGAVVHRELRARGEDRLDVPVVLFDQRGGGLVLRRQRIGRAQRELGAAGLEREHQDRSLRGHVQARAESDPLERLLLREPLADLAQHRHRLLGPFDPEPPVAGEREVLDVVLDHGASSFLVLQRGVAPAEEVGAVSSVWRTTRPRRRAGPSRGSCAPM